MKRFVEGTDRGQSALFPECLDDLIDENNPVRVIEAFVEALDLGDLEFAGVEPAETGRPAGRRFSEAVRGSSPSARLYGT